MRLLLAVLLACAACAPAAGGSGIRGTILAGPACPGPARLDSPCPDRPVALRAEVVQAGAVVATFSSDVTGHFSVALAPGIYTLRSTGGLPALRSSTVVVSAGAYTEVELRADTGMR